MTGSTLIDEVVSRHRNRWSTIVGVDDPVGEWIIMQPSFVPGSIVIAVDSIGCQLPPQIMSVLYVSPEGKTRLLRGSDKRPLFVGQNIRDITPPEESAAYSTLAVVQ